MDYRRIIPCLDTRDGKLVKGVNFVNLKVLGDPAEVGAAYSDAGADELVFLDITATLEGRQTFFAAVERTVKRLSIPLTVGGGVSSLSDMRTLFELGVSKVSMNSAAVRNPELVREAAQEFGSDRITVAIDTRKNADMPSTFEVVVRGGTQGAGLDAVEWTKRVVQLGAGAILPTSMDADGMQTGYDLPMTRAIVDAAQNIPVIASGGAGTLEHLYEAITQGGVDAVLVASIAHYGTFTIEQMKRYLADRGIPVRL